MRYSLVLLLLAPVVFAQEPVQLGTAIYRGAALPYQVMWGHAIFEDDIDLGPVDELESGKGNGSRESLNIMAGQFRWTNATIPYEIDPAIPNPQRVMDAIQIWNTQTPIKLVPHSGEANFLRFIQQNTSGVCFSQVGMVGGMQTIRVDDACLATGIAHEIGHTVGLQHEQNRADRNFYLQVNFANYDKRYFADSTINVPSGQDAGPYDFGSIMEYTRFSFANGRQKITHETIPPGIVIDGGQHSLSAGDIDNVYRMYGQALTSTAITSNPPGLQVIVDGVAITTPQSYNWAPGSVHTVDVPDKQGDGTPARYLFARWSDFGAQAHSITASDDLTVYSAHFIRQFLVKTNTAPSGVGSVTVTPASPDGYYTDGTPLTLTAEAAAGYTFQTWSTTGSFIFLNQHPFGAPVIEFLVTIPNLNYIAQYTRSAFVTITTDPPNLPVTVNGSAGPGPRNVIPAAGQPIQVSAAPVISFTTGPTQYVFDSWSDGGAAAHTITLPASGPMPTITATYQVRRLVTTAFTGQGTVTVTPSSPDGYYPDGATVQITAVPAAGYQFAGWSRDLSGTTATQTVTVNQQVYAVASFQRPFVLSAPNIVNGASFLSGPVSPGELLTLFGLQIGPSPLTVASPDASGKFPTNWAGTRVLFDGHAAPVFYTSSNQIAVFAPYEIAGQANTSVQVELNGQKTPPVILTVAPSAPGILTLDSSGRGQALILNYNASDGTVTLNTSTNPAARGSAVIMYATGEGQTNPGGVDGLIATAAPLPAPLQPVTVRIGGPRGVGVPAQVLYGGAAGGEIAGVLQINFLVPSNIPSGSVPISFAAGGNDSFEMTTIAVQ